MTTATATDERIARTSTVTKLLKRPEIGAAVAAVVIFIFFATTTSVFATPSGASTWLRGASTIGIMAVAVALLMIGGEFDLSAGAITGFTGLVVGVLTTEYGLNIWAAILVSLALALGVGAVNGILVMKTGLPSFIVTLGTFFVLQGIDLAGTKALIGQVAIQGMSNVPYYASAKRFFGSSTEINGGLVYASVFWWIGVTAVAT
ncbi:MAG: ABC transporter permease, partial [Candidatus Limnocylindrales bacterium]